MESTQRTDLTNFSGADFDQSEGEQAPRKMKRFNPGAMLKVTGVAMAVINAGNASVKSSQSILASDAHMSAPTRMSAGAEAYVGTAATSGAQKIAATKSAAISTLPSPVRAPAATPAALSI